MTKDLVPIRYQKILIEFKTSTDTETLFTDKTTILIANNFP